MLITVILRRVAVFIMCGGTQMKDSAAELTDIIIVKIISQRSFETTI